MLDEVIRVAMDDNTFRADDLEFTFAARVRTAQSSFEYHGLMTMHQGWSDCVSFGDFASYKDRFERIQHYFKPRFPDATRVGNEMIRSILAKT